MTIRDDFKDAAMTFGADVNRWPDDVRARFSDVIARGDAALLLREAAELDRVLSFAPGPSFSEQRLATDAVLKGIDAYARGDSETATANEVTSPGIWQRTGAAFKRLVDFLDWILPAGGKWQSASVLAASLVLGVALGATGNELNEASLLDTDDAVIVAETEIFTSGSFLDDFDTVETSDEDDLL